MTSNNHLETTPYVLTLVTEGEGIASASIPSTSINVPPSSSALVTVTYTMIDSTTLASVTGSPNGTARAKIVLSATDTATYRYTLHCAGSAIAANCDGGTKPDTFSLGVIQPESTSVFQTALETTSTMGAATGTMAMTVWRAAGSQTRDSATVTVMLDSSSPTDRGIADLNPGSTIG